MSNTPIDKAIEQVSCSSSNLRYAAFATLLCAVIATLNSLVCDVTADNDYAPQLLLGWLIAQIAFLSFFVGKFLPRSAWRWVFYGWALTLVNMLLTKLPIPMSFHSVSLGGCVVAAELAVLAVWLFLGAERWSLRLTGALILMPSLLVFLRLVNNASYYWLSLIVFQTFIVAALALLVRTRGYRVRRTAELAIDNRTFRFNLGDLLLWSVAVLPVLFLYQNGIFSRDLMSYLQPVMGVGFLIAITTALVTQVVLWGVLSDNPRWLRIPTLLLLPALAGNLIGRIMEQAYLGAVRKNSGTFFWKPWLCRETHSGASGWRLPR